MHYIVGLISSYEISQYIIFQAIDFNTQSYIVNRNANILDRKAMIFCWYHYHVTHGREPDFIFQNRHLPQEITSKFRERMRYRDPSLPVSVYRTDRMHMTEEDIKVSYAIKKNETSPIERTLEEKAFWAEAQKTFMNPLFSPLMSKSFAGKINTIFQNIPIRKYNL